MNVFNLQVFIGLLSLALSQSNNTTNSTVGYNSPCFAQENACLSSPNTTNSTAYCPTGIVDMAVWYTTYSDCNGQPAYWTADTNLSSFVNNTPPSNASFTSCWQAAIQNISASNNFTSDSQWTAFQNCLAPVPVPTVGYNSPCFSQMNSCLSAPSNSSNQTQAYCPAGVQIMETFFTSSSEC